jgi:VIT1/CCC1 family predicted Fe2+/Mn2+ transporter
MFNVKKSFKVGVSFGMVSGVLTTLGLLIGLGVSTQSKTAVIGGILTIAIADALSDAFGVHLSQEASGDSSTKHVWEATISTFLSKFIFALTFLIPVYFLNIKYAIVVSSLWGLFLISLLSILISKGMDKKERVGVVLEHFVLFLLVVLSSYFIGVLIDRLF